MENTKELLQEISHNIGKLQEAAPELTKSFMDFFEKTEKEGALSKKTKELISVALAIAKQCKWCIAFHIKNALDAGATKEELIESCFTAVLMSGGPGLMYCQIALKAIEELSS